MLVFAWSGFDTQMPVLGVGNPNPETAKKIFKLEIKTGVYKKIMQCSAFFQNQMRKKGSCCS